MATYTVIQDIEAEDHILGPLTLRQFIYALIATVFYYFCFLVITKNVAFLLLLFLPPAAFFTFFAFPFRKDQPTEIWALAIIQFLFRPRIRVWKQDTIHDLVTITAPKKIEKNLTNGLKPYEVKSRLEVLSNALDTRGWAIKNIQTNPTTEQSDVSDRLISIQNLPQNVPDLDTSPKDDILNDDSKSYLQINNLLTNAETKKRQRLNEILSPTQAELYRSTIDQPPVKPNEDNLGLQETQLTSELESIQQKRNLANANLHTLPTQPSTIKKTTKTQTATPIINPVKTNDDDHHQSVAIGSSSELSIESVADEANKISKDNEEIVINLQ